VENCTHAVQALLDRGICAKSLVLCMPLTFDAFMNAMEFQIEKNSPVPVIKQIQEKIKLSGVIV
jgi:hypothetical protein